MMAVKSVLIISEGLCPLFSLPDWLSLLCCEFRQAWGEYFAEQGVNVVFWSAVEEAARIQGEKVGSFFLLVHEMRAQGPVCCSCTHLNHEDVAQLVRASDRHAADAGSIPQCGK